MNDSKWFFLAQAVMVFMVTLPFIVLSTEQTVREWLSID
jgi:hypothetical protein